jgi:hypothetical protein
LCFSNHACDFSLNPFQRISLFLKSKDRIVAAHHHQDAPERKARSHACVSLIATTTARSRNANACFWAGDMAAGYADWAKVSALVDRHASRVAWPAGDLRNWGLALKRIALAIFLSLHFTSAFSQTYPA